MQQFNLDVSDNQPTTIMTRKQPAQTLASIIQPLPAQLSQQ